MISGSSSAVRVGAAVLGAAMLCCPRGAGAQPAPSSTSAEAARPALVLPTRVTVPRPPSRAPVDREALALASSLDVLLSDTAQDLGHLVELSDRSAGGVAPGEIELAARARALGGYVVATTIEPAGDEVELRMVLADDTTPLLRVRVERVARAEVPVRAVILLRDLLRVARAAASPPTGRRASAGAAELVKPARSEGRTVLAVNATLFGGYLGYSVLRASGSEDPRLLYPLLAVGAGVGLGASVIATEEWDTGVGDAWFLAASAWWPSLAGHLIYEGRFRESMSPDERWTFGLVGGATGVALGTLVLATHDVPEGGAAAAHSGGGLGLVLGGLVELFVRGDIDETPFAGMGYGAGGGWLLGAALLSRLDVSTGRVLAIDLGALLGGLGGAALASPLVFDEPSTDQQRGWVGATAGAAVLGAGVAWLMTRSAAEAPGATAVDPAAVRRASAGSLELPTVGLVQRPALRGAARFGEGTADLAAPIYGVSWRGSLR